MVLRKKIKHLTRRNGFIPTALIRLRHLLPLPRAKDRATLPIRCGEGVSAPDVPARGGARYPAYRAPDAVTQHISNCQRTVADHRQNHPTVAQPHDIITCPRKVFLCGRGKIRGVPKKRFQCANHYQPSINNNYLTFCFCAAGKEIGGVPKIKFGVRSAECGIKLVPL
jgi:hypothetical protein